MRKKTLKMKLGVCLLMMGLIVCPHIAAASDNSVQQDIVSPEAVSETVPVAVSLEEVNLEEKSVALAWEPLQEICDYTVMCKDGNEWSVVIRTEDNHAIIPEGYLEKANTYKICAYDVNGELRGESDEFDILLPDRIDKLYTTALSKTKVRVSWNVSEGTTAYQVYIKSEGEDYRLEKTVTEPEVSLTVKEKEDYYFLVIPVFESQIGNIKGEEIQTEFKNQEIVSLEHKKYSYKKLCADLKALQKKYNDYVSYKSIGKSRQKRDIYDVVLGNPEAGNTILVVSTLHGREYIATVVCMKQLEFYLQNYNKTVDGEKLSELFENCNIHYIMMANPDGVTISQTKSARWKSNANGVDLNRNFPYKFKKKGKAGESGYSGKKAASEPETKAVIVLTEELEETQDLAVVNYHAMGNIVYGDYDGKNTSLKKRIKQMHHIACDTTGYAAAPGGGGTSYGNYREYLIYKLKVPSVTLEVGSKLCPVPQAQYASEFKRNKLVVLREAKWLLEN